MIRFPAVAILLSCLAAPLWAQTQPAQAPSTTSMAKVAVKKPTPRAKASAKPVAAADTAPCRVGVIAATGDLFTVQKVGLTIFGNEFAAVPVSWGLDDLIFARVQAAAGGVPVRRIAYVRSSFDAYYHPKTSLFRNEREELATLVRQIASSVGCDRYLVVTRLEGQFKGTNQMLNGVGIVNHGTSLFSRTYLFANIGVTVFDGHTFEIRKDPNASFAGVMAHLASNLTQDETMRELDNSAFPTSPLESANSATLRDGTRAFLADRLDKILPSYFKE